MRHHSKLVQTPVIFPANIIKKILELPYLDSLWANKYQYCYLTRMILSLNKPPKVYVSLPPHQTGLATRSMTRKSIIVGI